jgi:hypothetical protein
MQRAQLRIDSRRWNKICFLQAKIFDPNLEPVFRQHKENELVPDEFRNCK